MWMCEKLVIAKYGKFYDGDSDEGRKVRVQ